MFFVAAVTAYQFQFLCRLVRFGLVWLGWAQFGLGWSGFVSLHLLSHQFVICEKTVIMASVYQCRIHIFKWILNGNWLQRHDFHLVNIQFSVYCTGSKLFDVATGHTLSLWSSKTHSFWAIFSIQLIPTNKPLWNISVNYFRLKFISLRWIDLTFFMNEIFQTKLKQNSIQAELC